MELVSGIDCIVLIGPSASCKNTIGIHLEKLGFKKLVTHTSREKRKNEKHSYDYYFVDNDYFYKNDFIETNVYNNYTYGLSKLELDNAISNDVDCYVILDLNGYNNLCKKYGKIVNIIPIVLKTDINICEKRMKSRNDNEEKIKSRLEFIKKSGELDWYKNFDSINVIDVDDNLVNIYHLVDNIIFR